ncbi:MAG: gamma-glutamyltransferase family protein [Halobacteriales archaeon]|nr:gamma-glutamyltransferase family protein [Halobacteriales archaeon]
MTADIPNTFDGPGDRNAARPVIRGRSGVVAAGHPLAAAAGHEILRQGGNAIDAGVAAGLVTNVVHHDMTSFGGVAPIILYSAADETVHTVSGVGRWPEQASIEYFEENHDGGYPEGILRSVVPAAPDAWITALKLGGQLTFGEVASPATRIARNGYPVYEFQHENIKKGKERYAAYPSTADVMLSDGSVPAVGEPLVQEALAETFDRLAAAEREHDERERGLTAARDYFYTGPIAETIGEFSETHGGLLRQADLMSFAVGTESPVHIEYKDYDVYTCGPWSQGPVFAQTLAILEAFDLRAMGHNSAEYIHTLLEALKLAFADREWYYGDPDFVDVPIDELTAAGYGAQRAQAIAADDAMTELPSPGETSVDPTVYDLDHLKAEPTIAASPFHQDTSYIAAMDADGNVFSATPSDSCGGTPMIPELGIPISTRGSQSRLDPRHPNRLEPGKRPRLTPNPALVLKDGQPFMALGTPGGDVQPQAMVQVFLNQVEFGMNPQQAIEAPRVATYNFPASFFPHNYYPGVSAGEGGIDDTTFARLNDRGHDMQRWNRLYRAGGVNVARRDADTGVLLAGADLRRENYALGE